MLIPYYAATDYGVPLGLANVDPAATTDPKAEGPYEVSRRRRLACASSARTVLRQSRLSVASEAWMGAG